MTARAKAEDALPPLPLLTEEGNKRPGPGSRLSGRLDHDCTLHAAMAFDGTSKVIDARRERQVEFESLTGGQGSPLLERVGLSAGFRCNLDPGLSGKGTLKPVCFPALVPHHEVQGLPCLHIDPSG